MAPSAVIKDTPMDLYLQPGPARGIWREQATGALGSPQVSVRWRGLIELATTSDTGLDGKPAQASRLTNIDLVGDWQNLKPGNALGYSKTLTPSTGKPFVQKFECSVGESAPAAQHVASLQGLARNVTCSADNGLKSSSTYLYLEAYDLFVETAERSMLLVQVQNSRLRNNGQSLATRLVHTSMVWTLGRLPSSDRGAPPMLALEQWWGASKMTEHVSPSNPHLNHRRSAARRPRPDAGLRPVHQPLHPRGILVIDHPIAVRR